MSRGRRAKPAEIKQLLGNPGKRKLALDKAAGGDGKPAAAPAAPRRISIPAPDYLTKDEEKAAFKMAVSSLPANIARRSDVHSIARWAVWLNIWVTSKIQMDSAVHWYESKSKHGTFLREHPISKRMHQAEAHLVTLEDRLCLNITARNNIVHKLFQMPAAPNFGQLFGDEQPPAEGADKNVPPHPPLSPIGFMRDAGKPH